MFVQRSTTLTPWTEASTLGRTSFSLILQHAHHFVITILKTSTGYSKMYSTLSLNKTHGKGGQLKTHHFLRMIRLVATIRKSFAIPWRLRKRIVQILSVSSIQIDWWHTDKHGIIQSQPSSNYVPLTEPEVPLIFRQESNLNTERNRR